MVIILFQNRLTLLRGGLRFFVPAIVIALSIFFATNVVASASCSCPSGFTPKSFQYTLATTSCEITINYCTNCSPTGHSEIHLCDIVVPYGCIFNLTPSFWQLLKIAMIQDAVSKCSFGIPPCEGLPREQYDLYMGSCKQLFYDDNNSTLYIIDCDEEAGICKSTFDVCFNSQTQQYQVNYTGSTVVDPGECGPAFPEIDWNDRFTECFTVCN